MSVNVSGNIISSTGFTSSGEIINTPNIVTDGLVLWYDAGNFASYNSSTSYYDCGYGCQYYGSNPGCTNCNTQIKDMSGYGNDGTLTNSTTIGYNNTGGYMNFAGTGFTNYVNVADNVSIQLTNVGTLSAWIYPNSLTQGSYANIISKSSGGSSGQQSYTLTWRQISGVFQAQITTAAGVTNLINYSLPSIIGWYNFVFTWDGSYLNLYQNGVATTPVSQTINNQNLSTSVTIGGYTYKGAGGADEYFNGKIAIVQIYNRSLSSTEVLQNFNSDRQRFGI